MKTSLDQANGSYRHRGTQHGVLKLSSPFDVDVDLTEIDNL